MKKRLSNAKTNWVEEWASVLWSYKTTLRKTTGESSFSLCFVLEVLILIEVDSSSTWNDYFEPEQNEQLLQENLLLIENVRHEAARKDEHVKRAAARYHNFRVRPSGIKAGDLVLRKSNVSTQEPSRKLDAF